MCNSLFRSTARLCHVFNNASEIFDTAAQGTNYRFEFRAAVLLWDLGNIRAYWQSYGSCPGIETLRAIDLLCLQRKKAQGREADVLTATSSYPSLITITQATNLAPVLFLCEFLTRDNEG